MTDFVNALVHAELFLLGVASAPASQPADAATTTISFSASDYRSAAG
ncbi:hypothetical protein [Bordetella petrii]|nr:hypothetical protein [Bordetella petrii]MBO1111872.1 hypothetical protein [Bordetella petrii]